MLLVLSGGLSVEVDWAQVKESWVDVELLNQGFSAGYPHSRTLSTARLKLAISKLCCYCPNEKSNRRAHIHTANNPAPSQIYIYIYIRWNNVTQAPGKQSTCTVICHHFNLAPALATQWHQRTRSSLSLWFFPPYSLACSCYHRETDRPSCALLCSSLLLFSELILSALSSPTNWQSGLEFALSRLLELSCETPGVQLHIFNIQQTL